jgi:hypothetical protein
MLRPISSLDATRFIRHDTDCDEENGQETAMLRLGKYKTSHMCPKVIRLLLILLISSTAHRFLLSRPYRRRQLAFESHYIRFALLAFGTVSLLLSAYPSGSVRLQIAFTEDR